MKLVGPPQGSQPVSPFTVLHSGHRQGSVSARHIAIHQHHPDRSSSSICPFPLFTHLYRKTFPLFPSFLSISSQSLSSSLSSSLNRAYSGCDLCVIQFAPTSAVFFVTSNKSPLREKSEVFALLGRMQTMNEFNVVDHPEVPMERLPEDYEWYKQQIAGHHQAIIKNGERQIGFLKEKRGDLILKLVQEGIRGECEVQVYTRLAELRNQSTVEDDGGEDNEKVDVVADQNKIIIQQLAQLVPAFYGVTKVTLGNTERQFLKLEDLTMRFRYPCIMDVKVGKVTFDPLATVEKSTREMSKYPEQQKLGFRLLGYRLHHPAADLEIADKKWGLSWNSENIDDGFNDYMKLTRENRTQIIGIFKKHLRGIHEWFSHQRVYHFYASSLLFIYDSAPAEEGPVADVRMIDFSHTFPACKSTDQNYLFGLNRICEIFQRL
ncbi:hypothetical protein QR680_003428 [Steinernema hermaphroditum]|uniref:Kinase n=1 Tax=Steinernema hermaphroditum TaxID=289476 RepID=A0AA39LKC6_9BILA|nr:hypothetical protein QR680_003428 [Steinernema hermaphroditum]